MSILYFNSAREAIDVYIETVMTISLPIMVNSVNDNIALIYHGLVRDGIYYISSKYVGASETDENDVSYGIQMTI